MSAIDRLRQIMVRLRDPAGGCPWDREQDWASIAPHTIEEAYELATERANRLRFAAVGRTDPVAREDLPEMLLTLMFHPDLYDRTLTRLLDSNAVWAIENVPHAPFDPDVVLCGSMFGLPIRRHRWFIGSPSLLPWVQPCTHRSTDLAFDHGGTTSTESEYRDAMGCDWMTVKESRNAIPPAYTEWIGTQLLAHLSEATRLDTAATEAERPGN